MARGRLRSEWRQTASVIATLCELNRDRKKRPERFSPDDFDPFAESRDIEVRGDITCLKMLVPKPAGKPADGRQ